MTPEQVQVERALIALGGKVSDELMEAAVQVANAAATDPIGRAAVEIWVRARGVWDVIAEYGDVGFHEFHILRVLWLFNIDDPAVVNSIERSVEAVWDFLSID